MLNSFKQLSESTLRVADNKFSLHQRIPFLKNILSVSLHLSIIMWCTNLDSVQILDCDAKITSFPFSRWVLLAILLHCTLLSHWRLASKCCTSCEARLCGWSVLRFKWSNDSPPVPPELRLTSGDYMYIVLSLLQSLRPLSFVSHTWKIFFVFGWFKYQSGVVRTLSQWNLTLLQRPLLGNVVPEE